MRGSDPDAALYWLVQHARRGADPTFMARRLVRMATEDNSPRPTRVPWPGAPMRRE
ncbi:MAG: hypothetical protein IPH37_01265 [Burkholderiales bacterium]|nr:hypothetical protein [Burkholderiales bacterium]